MKEIGSTAFGGCRELKEIKLPSSLEKVDNDIFASCGKLEDIIIDKGTINKFENLLPEEYWDLLVEA